MNRQRRWLSRYFWLASLPFLLLAGCHGLAPELVSASPPACWGGCGLWPPQHEPGPEPKPAPAGPLTLDQVIRIALDNHPDLASAYAKAEAARGEMIQAGLYPNPTVGYMGEEINNPQNRLGFQGAFVSQQIITAGKLRLAQAAAAQGVTVASWQAMTKRYELITRARLAYFEVLTAQRELRANEEIVKIAQESLDVARAAERAGTGARPDVLRAEVELNQSKNRLIGAQQRAEAAWKLLALAVGVPKLPPTELAGSLADPAPAYDWCDAVAATLIRSSEVQAAQASISEMEWNLQRQVREPVPNITVQAGPIYDFPDQSLEANVQVGINLPLFNKNQGNILAAQAALAGAQQDARGVELRLIERLTQAYQRYQTARQQVEIYEQQIKPRAEESLRLVKIGYGAGDAKFDYTAVLQAQQILVQARLAAIQAQGELWKAVSDIAGVVQLDTLAMPPGLGATSCPSPAR